MISSYFLDHRLKNVDFNSDNLLEIHNKILFEKKALRDVFEEFYNTCIELNKKYFSGPDFLVEIGAGVSFFKRKYPQILATDIKSFKNLDMVVDALNMPWHENSVRAIFGINCFHHFPDPNKFFHELERVLHSGGGCVLIEPYYGGFAQFLYKRLFTTEGFDKKQKDWINTKNNIMVGANQALSYIVFIRDKSKFEQRFPQLEIVSQYRFNNYMRYLLSGGLNFRSLTPSWFIKPLKFIELILRPFSFFFALHYCIVIRKKKQ